MNDYHQRFRERFVWTPAQRTKIKDSTNPEDILAFIDEEIARSAKEYLRVGKAFGYADGKRETRTPLIEKVEGMRREYRQLGDRSNEYEESLYLSKIEALDDILTYLRGEQAEVSQTKTSLLCLSPEDMDAFHRRASGVPHAKPETSPTIPASNLDDLLEANECGFNAGMLAARNDTLDAVEEIVREANSLPPTSRANTLIQILTRLKALRD
jgi:hypothetical protein